MIRSPKWDIVVPSETRARRVADRINRELAILLQRKVADPRLAGLNVTGVDVDRELAYATIYVTAQNDEQEVLRALDSARGFLRKQLASNIPLRSFPQLRFRWDYSPDRGARVDELLDRLEEERQEQDRSTQDSSPESTNSEDDPG
ncbi:MAG: 30S ribosome-binding factor RbfA [Anaerolineales bacterium]